MRYGGVKIADARDKVSSAIEASRDELLDLGLRNPLLNYRPSKARGVEVVDELPTEIFRILVDERKAMTFKAGPEDLGSETEQYDLLAQPEEVTDDGGPAARHVDRQLQTNVPSAKLQSRLLKTDHDARVFIEEQGVSILFLALGMLRWFESSSSQEPRRAPLILIPVTLERSNVRERFRLKYTEEDLDDNLSLMNKLRLEFGIQLPQMPPQEDLDVAAYFDVVEESVRGEPRWSVDQDAVVLGFFSFGKLLMYRDLDKGNWPQGRGPSDHPIIKVLFDDNPSEAEAHLPEDEFLDRHLDPAEVHQVMDADSSQTLALLDVKSGRNLVVQGPPGTGKSQTITNIIAEAVGHGRTVLFVAEKMAALEVVKRRLDAVGLGEACLELHSRKANKRLLLQELDRTIRLGRPRLEEAEEDLRLLTEMRDRLNTYSEAMNTPIGESGVTPYRAIGELTRLGPETASLPRLDFEEMRHWSGADFRRRQDVVEELQAQLSRTGPPSQNPFYGSKLTVLIPTDQAGIAQALADARRTTRELRESAADLASALALSVPETRSEVESLCRAARFVTRAPRVEDLQLRAEEWRTRRDDLEALISAGKGYREIQERYGEVLIPEAWDQDLLETRQHLSTHGRKWLRFMSGDYRRARDRLSGLCRGTPPEDVEQQLALVDAVLDARRNLEVIRRHGALTADLFGTQWQGERSDWAALGTLLDWVVDLHHKVGEGQLPEELVEFIAEGRAREGLESKIATVEGALVEQGSRAG